MQKVNFSQFNLLMQEFKSLKKIKILKGIIMITIMIKLKKRA
jgi:hypothetical protein